MYEKLKRGWLKTQLLFVTIKAKGESDMELPKRKTIRLKEYDYSTPNAYFITVCTNKRENLFWKDVGAALAARKMCR